MQLFYTPEIKDDSFILDEQESKHCVRVLRMSKGENMHLTDGKGNLYRAVIEDNNPKACKLKIIEKQTEFGKRNYYLHIAIAPTKNIDRLEWFLEKVTEIGVDEITPILCEHSERKQIKTERLERVIVAAMKQSLKTYKPILNELTAFNEFMQKDFSDNNCYIAHCYETEKTELKEKIENHKKLIVLIGPEGDFSEEEIKIASDNSFIPVSLGKSRLRTETAGVVACHTVNLLRD